MINDPLNILVGEQVNGVAFVEDYVEFHFNGPVLRAIADPILESGQTICRFPAPGSRDAFAGLIGRTIEEIVTGEDGMLVTFDSGAVLRIPLDASGRKGGEAAHFVPTGGGNILVW